jgi:probable O-glycosylation ligase (exosortase A-associated)
MNIDNIKEKLKSPIMLTFFGISLSFFIIMTYIFYGFFISFSLLLLPFVLFLIIRHSVIFVILFILFSYFRIHEAFPILMDLKIPRLLALSSFFGIFWHLFLTKKLKPFWNSSHTVFMTLFLWLTVSVFAATNKDLSLEYWTSTLTKVFIMVFVISWWINNSKAFNLTRLGIIISGGLIASVAVYNKINGIGLVEGTRVTISRDLKAQIGDPNDLSLVLLFSVSFLCAELMNKKHKLFYKIIILAILSLVIYGVIATQSRGGLLGILVIIGYFISKKIKNPLVLIPVGFSLLLLLLAFAGINDRQSGGDAEQGIDESAMGRIYAWQAAFNMALSNPLTGVGINNFYANYFYYSPHWDGRNHAVHSTWFQILSETGFVGFLLFAIMIATIYRILKRSELYQLEYPDKNINVNIQALKAGLLGFMVSGTFLTQAFTWPIYIIFALSVGLEHMLHSNKKYIKGDSNDRKH